MNLDDPGVCSLVADKLKQDIDAYAAVAYNDGHRWHLGASEIGHECSRYLYYTFHWCSSEFVEPRALRLLKRGHLEELRYTEYLLGIGAEVWTRDENGKQFTMNAVLGGHYGGSGDGFAKLPASYLIEEPILLEFKTNGTGRSFDDVIKLGMQIAKGQHFMQMSAYGKYWKLRYGAYFITNKNDDDLEIQVVKLDWSMADQLERKASEVILATEPPPKLSLDPTFWKCKYCKHELICHKGKKPEVNCRSCKFSQPVNDGEWYCNVHKNNIPRDFVKQACPHYRPLVNE